MTINKESGFGHVLAIVAAVVVVGVIGGGLAVYHSHASTCIQNTYKQGIANTKCVGAIQKLANAQLNNSQRTGVDGKFGGDTKRVVELVQKQNPGTKSQVDGIVGKNTWKALCNPNSAKFNVSDMIKTNPTFKAARIDAGC